MAYIVPIDSHSHIRIIQQSDLVLSGAEFLLQGKLRGFYGMLFTKRFVDVRQQKIEDKDLQIRQQADQESSQGCRLQQRNIHMASTDVVSSIESIISFLVLPCSLNILNHAWLN